MNDWSHIAKNLAEIQERIKMACDLVQRDPGTVTLIAVSKTFPEEAVQVAYDLGHRHFGESRLQEGQTKVHALPRDIIWHFIGHLQSNKAKKTADLFDVIHTIENAKQMDQIAKSVRTIDGFLQVNLGREQQKSGIFTETLDETIDLVLKCQKIRLQGLMTIGPIVPDPEESRPIFRELARMANERKLKSLSMGMSQDFEIAIQEGATHIRVGTSIFGRR